MWSQSSISLRSLRLGKVLFDRRQRLGEDAQGFSFHLSILLDEFGAERRELRRASAFPAVLPFDQRLGRTCALNSSIKYQARL